MQVTINGILESGSFNSLLGLLKDRNMDVAVVVVEHNGNIVAPGDYANTNLQDGDTIEIVQFVGGG